MTTKNQYGRPLFVSNFQSDNFARSLTRMPLQAKAAGPYDEAWLQNIIMQHPSLLPIEDIEPALTPAIPICTELAVPSGSIDNLYVTPAGDVIVVEAKLWRNPEA